MRVSNIARKTTSVQLFNKTLFSPLRHWPAPPEALQIPSALLQQVHQQLLVPVLLQLPVLVPVQLLFPVLVPVLVLLQALVPLPLKKYDWNGGAYWSQ
jgi:hypothetical protein